MSLIRLKLGNCCIGLLNLLAMLCSLGILASVLWLRKSVNPKCERLLEDIPLIVGGIFLMIVSFTGLIGACRAPSLLFIYLVFMLVFIVAAVCFTVFVFLVVNKGAGEFVSGKGYKEYRIGDYSNWLQKRINDTGKWDKIKSCMADSDICTNFHGKVPKDSTNEKFWKLNPNALQAGCCVPPKECGFTHKSPSKWTEEEGTYKNPDCRAWDNDKSVLCFNCQSCKAGLLHTISTSWKTVTIFNAGILVLLIFVLSIACCAFGNMTK